MKTKIKTMLVTIALMVATNFTALGQQTAQNTGKAELSVEVDPSTFVFRGDGVHIRYKPKNCNHLLLGVGAYAMDSATGGSNNIAIGNWAMRNNTTGGYNIALGLDALGSNTEGNSNVALGVGALYSNT